jgi:aminoglycoside/choline kinase family phosphotransferase
VTLGTTAVPEEIRTRLLRYLHDSGDADRVRALHPLTPDASDRRYVRVERDDRSTFVVAVHAGPIEFAGMPFANVAALLTQMPIPAPAVLGHSDALGVIALEDLGDVTLQAHLVSAAPAERRARYQEAVALLERLQRRGAELASGRGPYTLAFDVEKLTWELDFFATHFLGAHRHAGLGAAESAALREEFAALATELAGEPRVLCHRDYHSRNLMLHAGALSVIDFQDARMGPDTYDLASLLRDSYVDLEEAEVERLIGHFLALTAAGSIRPSGPGYAGDFRRRFDLMSLQRNLKALGTFGFQATSRRNPAYLRDVPRTLGYVSANLSRYPRFARLQTLLASHLPELR